MPARVARGIRPAQRPKKSVMIRRVSAWMIPATGVRPPFFTFVAVRAIAPVAGMPPNSGAAMFATPCATSSMLDRCLPPIMPSATTADNSDSIPARSAIVNAGPTSAVTVGEGHAGERRTRNAGVDGAEPAADRLDRQREQMHHGGGGEQGDERPRDPHIEPRPQQQNDEGDAAPRATAERLTLSRWWAYRPTCRGTPRAAGPCRAPADP